MEDHIGYSLGEDDIKKEEVEIELSALATKVEPPRVHEISRLQCHVCYKIMGHRSSLYKHLKYVHKIEPAHRLPISCREKDCFQSFTFIDPFRRHLAEQHGFNIVVENYVFQSMSDFFCWKKVTEEEENLRFIVSTGPRNSKGGKTHYYRCQKNGAYKPEIKKRLQSDDKESIYNISTTHCISSMLVFEEPECVTVEFCRTHYGHDVNNKASTTLQKIENSNESYCSPTSNENSVCYETVDSTDKLNSLLSEKDKDALVNILQKNQHLLQETEELFYENEHDVILKIPYSILRSILEDSGRNIMINISNEGDENLMAVKDEIVCHDTGGGKLNDEEDEEDGENSAILKSLGNGVFLDPTSNKRLKLDSYKKKTRCKEKNPSTEPLDQQETIRKDKDKSNTMLVKEYLNEYDEKVYVLELIKEEETVVQKREKILSQLQTILMMVNSEDDMEVLDDIQSHLSKYAPPDLLPNRNCAFALKLVLLNLFTLQVWYRKSMRAYSMLRDGISRSADGQSAETNYLTRLRHWSKPSSCKTVPGAIVSQPSSMKAANSHVGKIVKLKGIVKCDIEYTKFTNYCFVVFLTKAFLQRK